MLSLNSNKKAISYKTVSTLSISIYIYHAYEIYTIQYSWQLPLGITHVLLKCNIPPEICKKFPDKDVKIPMNLITRFVCLDHLSEAYVCVLLLFLSTVKNVAFILSVACLAFSCCPYSPTHVCPCMSSLIHGVRRTVK